MGKLNIGEGQDYGNPGDSIPAKLPDGSVVNAIAATPINNATVLVAITDDGQPYAFNNPSILSVPDRELSRSSPPRKPPAIALDYPFKVLVEGTGISVQGFDEDANLANSDGYTAIGLTNTGDGYAAIAKSGNTYLFDVDGEQKTKTLSNADFGLTYVPSLDWYGGDIIYGFNQDFGEVSNESYTFTNSGCINSVSQFGTLTWSEFISRNPNEITIPYSISQVNHSGSESGEGNIGQLVRKYDWQLGLMDETFNNYSYLTYDIDKSGQTVWWGLFSSFFVTRTIQSQQNLSYTQQFIALDGDTLTVLNKKIVANLNANVVRTIDKIPRTQTFVNYDVDDFTGTVTKTATLTPFNLSYCNPLHTIQIDFSDEWVRNYQHKYYVFSAKRVGYTFTFSWNDSGTGAANSRSINVTHDFDENEDSSSSAWTIEIGESYNLQIGGNQYAKGYVWVYRVTDPDGVISAWREFDDSMQTVKRDLMQFDFNDQKGGPNGDGWKPVTPYLYATQPTITSTVKTTDEFRTRNIVIDEIYRDYTNDEERNISFLESRCNLILNSNRQNIVLYWFHKNHYTSLTISFHEYNVKQVSDGLGTMNVTTTVRPNTTTLDNFYYNPSTYTLGVKLNTTFYEIKDFDGTNGFNFENRFYAYNTTTISEPNLGNNTFSATFNIGLKNDNKGNYQNVIKRFKSNGTPPYERTYHPITVFNPIGLNINLYWVSSRNVKKYTGTITSITYTTSTNSTTNETTRNYTGLTVNLVEKEDVDFICHCNNYENGIFITTSNDYTRFLLEYIIYDIRQVNCYEEDGKMRIAIAKTVTADNIDGEDEWFADIYEFDTVNKKFIRIGNESGSLSEINGDQYNFISYYPA